MMLLVNILEKRILDFYASKTLTAKKYTFPFSSFIWLSYIFGNTFALLVILLAIDFGVNNAAVLQQMVNTIWGLAAMVFGLIYIIRWFGIKPTEDSDYYKLKRSIQALRSRLKKKNSRNDKNQSK
jgi:hypothetical protein